jgi:ankyrin repeat protein
MKLLLDYEPNIEAVTSMKRRAIHFAVLTGDLKYVDYLISCGANYDCCDMDKESSIHYASRLGYKDIVVYLLKKHVQITKNVFNETAIDLSANIDIYRVKLFKISFLRNI